MKAFSAVAIASILSACTTVEPQIEATKPWEGHFKTVEEFKKSTDSMTLGKKETVWVLSDRTLARVLKRAKEIGESNEK